MLHPKTYPTARIATSICLAFLLLASAPVAVADEHPGCGEASFLSPDDGQVNVNTQAGNTSQDTGSSVQGFFVSTTGFIEVEIEHHCLHFLFLEVFKVEADGTLTSFHDNTFRPGCSDEGIVTDEVPIGLDAGEYQFTLYWRDCENAEGGDGRRPVGVDPPLPLGRTFGF